MELTPTPQATERDPGQRRTRARTAAICVTVVATAAALLQPSGTSAAYATIAVALAAFGVAVALSWRAPGLPVLPLAVACGALLVLAVAVPPRQSRDLWTYAAYGRMVERHHVSPYRAAPADVVDPRLLDRMNPRWWHARSVYGPVFTGASAAGMRAAGDSPLAIRLFFQGLAAVATAAAIALVRRSTGDPLAVLAIGLNPLVIVSVVNGAHTDALAALPLLAAVLLAGKDRAAAAGLLVALAVLIKPVALLPGVAVAAWLLTRRGPRRAATFSAACAVPVVAGYWLAGGRAAVEPIGEVARLASAPSIWGSTAPRAAVGLGVAGLAAAIALLGHLRDRSPAPAATAAFAASLLVSPYVLPWYAALILPLAMLTPRRVASAIVLAYGGLLLLAYFPLRPTEDAAATVVNGFADAAPFLAVAGLAVLVGSSVAALRREPLTAAARTRERTASG